MSLAVVGAASAAGAVLHQRQGNLNGKAFALLGATGIAGAYLGTAFTPLVAPYTLMLIFASLMVVVGILMLSSGTDRLSSGPCHPIRCAVLGAVVGIVTGFLGVGGGFLIVPALVLFAGLDRREARTHSLNPASFRHFRCKTL